LSSLAKPDANLRVRLVYSIYTLNSIIILAGLIYARIKKKPKIIYIMMILNSFRNIAPFYNDDGGTGTYASNETVLIISL
jgi:hypothetical protein